MQSITNRHHRTCPHYRRLQFRLLLAFVTILFFFLSTLSFNEFVKVKNKSSNIAFKHQQQQQQQQQSDQQETTNNTLKKLVPSSLNSSTLYAAKVKRSATTTGESSNNNNDNNYNRSNSPDHDGNMNQTYITSSGRHTIEPESKTKPYLRLIHVINFYATSDNNDTNSLFYPLDQIQNVTIASIQRAYRNANKEHMQITIYCAILPNESYIIPNNRYNNDDDDSTISNIFKRTLLLNRSIVTEFPSLQPQRYLPFIDDMIKGVTNKKRNFYNNYDDRTNEKDIQSYDYLIYTNADIGLTNYFYDAVYYQIVQNGYDAFTVNRKNILLDKEQKKHDRHNDHVSSYYYFHDDNNNDNKNRRRQILTGNDLNVIDEELMNGKRGEDHSGYDCFIIHQTIVNSFKLGNLFIGYPPWGQTFHLILKSIAFQYKNFKSSSRGTFHIGNDKSWIISSSSSSSSKQKFTTTKNGSVESETTLNNSTEYSSNKPNNDNQNNTNNWVSPYQQKILHHCPFGLTMNWTDHSLQNTINCGLLFQSRIFYNHSKDKRNFSLVPNFVQEGFEWRFLEKQEQEQEQYSTRNKANQKIISATTTTSNGSTTTKTKMTRKYNDRNKQQRVHHIKHRRPRIISRHNIKRDLS